MRTYPRRLLIGYVRVSQPRSCPVGSSEELKLGLQLEQLRLMPLAVCADV